ncbi:Rha family transcriptional regulator [Campylobacter jejuni]|nr:Rha family transcriptional regulator [Campylobacter jejuni]EIT0961773.1 Rha family transcriptional regulator [Campylobacter jejuni]EIY8723221.1 Rha family transcriptional regulator [Campylobacter jejuni]EIZ5246816.1 Rha family transcriptional regulator [Campylobacter jejuni]ELA4787225.1 Rha family transcriptional regulator [Campylobacter jejuni]
MSNVPVIINNVEVNLNIKENKVFINSLDLAKVFNKNHKDVLETTKNQPQNDFTESNFILSTYKDKKGELRPCYNLTRDGFSLLVMGFTGEKAYKWKVEFIKAFNEMEKRLRNIEYEKHDKLAFRQSLGYKSQLKQQKEKYENKIKALKYDLEHKNELSFKRKLSEKELLELRKILAKDYDIVCFKEWEMSLVAEKIGKDAVFDAVLNKLEKELSYWQNYEKCEEKWKKILRS